MTTAIVNATIIDGTGRDPITRGTLIVENDRITGVGAGIEPPRAADVIDAGGSALMPGMIDCHVHLYGKVAPIHERPQLPTSLHCSMALRTLAAPSILVLRLYAMPGVRLRGSRWQSSVVSSPVPGCVSQ